MGNDKPKKEHYARPATKEELKEIERVTGESGNWMVGDTLLNVPVKVVKVGARLIKVFIRGNDE